MEILLTFAIAMLGALLAIPLLSAAARRVQLVDAPDEARKLHQNSIPLVGGISIFLATLFALGSLYFLKTYWIPSWEYWNLDLDIDQHDWIELWGLLIGGGVLLLVGILDDRYGIRGRQKLLGQIVACSIVIFSGYKFYYIELYGIRFEFGSFAALVSYLWLLGAINSVNLLDGADGFAGTVGALMGASFCIMSLVTGNPLDAAITAAFTGAVIGFLRFNLPPAKAYLGDAGSMLIGFLFGALAIRCTFKTASAYAFFGPMALLTIPLIDTTAAIIRRRLTGRSIFAVDRAHLHHTLASHGFGPRRSLLLVAMLSTLSALGGVMTVMTRQSEWAVISMGIVVAFLVSSRIFGFAEFQLLYNKFLSFARSFVSIGRKANSNSTDSTVQLQGIRDWQLIWQNVREFAEKHEFRTLKLHLHLPWLHEIFHAQYSKTGTELLEQDGEWYLVAPLNVRNRLIGEVEVVAFTSDQITPYETISQLIELLSDLEPMLVEIMESVQPPATVEAKPDEAYVDESPIGSTEGEMLEAAAEHLDMPLPEAELSGSKASDR